MISMARSRLAVFDLDGTLVDSRRDLAESANSLLDLCGAAPLPEAAIGQMVGDGAATLVARLFATAGLDQPDDALERFLSIYNSRLLRFTRPYEGIPEALTALADRTALAVLTNKPLAAARQVLDGLDLTRFFSGDRVLGGDGPFPRKPDPAGLLQLAASAGAAAAETVLVGDSFVDWQTARAAGAFVCLARYGFGYEGFPAHRLGPHDRVVDSPGELVGIL
jgi:phosphoglycolate phosphatase